MTRSEKKRQAAQPDAAAQAVVIMDIIVHQQQLKATHETALAEDIARIKSNYAPIIDKATAAIAAGEKELNRLMKKHRPALFDLPAETGSARRDLAGGHALIYSVVRRVRKIKGMLRKLKLAGMKKQIKVVESVDWDAVDALDDDLLVQLGTARELKETFAYEIKKGAV
jgi:phage host-nuclease inhibitor protein Gam